jgi:hypothetical protein
MTQDTRLIRWCHPANATRVATVLWLLILVTYSQRLVSPACAQPNADSARKWALLIGIEKYHRASPLRYTINDVKQIANTLTDRGDYNEDCILEIVDSAPNPRYQPFRVSLLAELPRFLKKPGPDDHVLVYFSGHGFKDQDGKLYLAPIDCDPADAAATGIAVEWFREQIASCKAETKLLVLDACHAGEEKGEDDTQSVSAKELGTMFRDLAGVLTLASSTSDEKSQIWEEKEQSLFSFWLNEGLKGHADRDSDASVTVDELYAYVYRHVVHSAKLHFPRPQTPVRIVRSGTLGVPEVTRLKPQRLRQVLADIAEQLSWSMQERQLSKVGVLEFTNDTKLGELLGADFGLLGRYCAEELARRLMDFGIGKFDVVDRRRLQSALDAQRFGLKDLGSPDALQGLAERVGGSPAIALGTLQNRTGRVVALQCSLMRTDQDGLAGMAGGTAILNESEWAMLGRSVQVRPDDRRPEIPSGGQTPRPIEEVVIDRLDDRSEGAHPLQDPDFPFRVRIMVKTRGRRLPTEREAYFRGNEMFVPLRKGEVYEIWVDNRTEQPALMRLLVDGLDTLPKKAAEKDMVVEGTAERPGSIAQRRVNLDAARAWYLDPKVQTTFAVRGFFSATSEGGKYNEFVVVDEQHSLAARERFTDQIGMITAAFYSPKAGSRAVGTGLGTERSSTLQEKKKVQVGDLRAVIHIRYVEPDTLD